MNLHRAYLVAAAAAVALCLTAGWAVAEVTMKRVTCMNLPNCLSLSNGHVEVIVTTDVGPRVIGYRLLTGRNVFAEMPGTVGAAEWQPWGGHRLWLAPEDRPFSYGLDNSPIRHAQKGAGTVVLDRGVEEETGILKVIEVTLDAESSKVTVVHRLTNHRERAVDVAPWSITIVRGGGTTILPNEPFVPHEQRLQPVRPMALWSYTDLSDPRWQLGRKYIRLSTDSSRRAPQKIGIGNRQGWAAYVVDADLFIKRIAPFDTASDIPTTVRRTRRIRRATSWRSSRWASWSRWRPVSPPSTSRRGGSSGMRPSRAMTTPWRRRSRRTCSERSSCEPEEATPRVVRLLD